MKNAFSRMGRTCAFLAIAGGLVAGSLMAGASEIVKLTLPHAVTVGSVTLPTGQYTISGLDMADGDQLLVVRSQNGHQVVTLQGLKSVETQPANKTEVQFTTDGDAWHFDKILIKGETDSFEFYK
jgi:hypothetical protein